MRPAWCCQRLDVVIGNYGTQVDEIHIQDASGGGFTLLSDTLVSAQAALHGFSKSNTHTVSLGDYDEDGFLDIFAGGLGCNSLYHNDGDGTFSLATAGCNTDTTASDACWWAAKQATTNTLCSSVRTVASQWGDFDGDGCVVPSRSIDLWSVPAACCLLRCCLLRCRSALTQRRWFGTALCRPQPPRPLCRQRRR